MQQNSQRYNYQETNNNQQVNFQYPLNLLAYAGNSQSTIKIIKNTKLYVIWMRPQQHAKMTT